MVVALGFTLAASLVVHDLSTLPDLHILGRARTFVRLGR